MIFYIKLSSSNKNKDTEKAMLSIIYEIEKQINENNTLPSALKYFPEEGLIKHTDKFISTEFLGYEFFKRSF